MKTHESEKNSLLQGLRYYERGDPAATPEALFQVVDAENALLRLLLGSHNLPGVRAAYTERLAIWEAWATVSNSAQGEAK